MLMSAPNLLTHFPLSSLPTKFNLSPHPLRFHLRCSSSRLYLSQNFRFGNSINSRKLGLMAEMGSRILALGSGDDEEKTIRVLEQEAFIDRSSQFRSDFAVGNFEANLNRLSKWLVAVLFGALILWRYDPEAIWAAMGSVLNSALSVILKRILNQERPTSNLRSDPGMPSSHAQSIFYAVFFIISSIVATSFATTPYNKPGGSRSGIGVVLLSPVDMVLGCICVRCIQFLLLGSTLCLPRLCYL